MVFAQRHSLIPCRHSHASKPTEKCEAFARGLVAHVGYDGARSKNKTLRKCEAFARGLVAHVGYDGARSKNKTLRKCEAFARGLVAHVGYADARSKNKTLRKKFQNSVIKMPGLNIC